MTEEKAGVEPEVVEELEGTLDPVVEPDPAVEPDVEGEVEPEAEPVDERGVPLKNRIAELERKLSASGVREDSYKELLTNLNKNTTKEHETQVADAIASLSDDEFNAVGIAPDVAKVLRRSQYVEAQRAIAARIAEADSQNKANQTTNKEFIANRLDSIKDAQEGLNGEFGNLVVDDGAGGVRYDGESPLFKRAKEIFDRSPKLQNLAAGPAIAAQKAEVELTREKYGKSDTKKISKAEKLKGTASGRGGDGKGVKVGGKFHRKLSINEFDKLSREERSEYNIWQVDHDTK